MHGTTKTDGKKFVILMAIFLASFSLLIYFYINFPPLSNLQTFAIPGSVFLSILAGYLYPFGLALFLICSCASIGSACCFLLSKLLASALIYKLCGDKLRFYSQKIARHRHNMLSYIIFLRITPILPNWLINLMCPLLGVPFLPYFLGTFLGVAPPSILSIQTGQTLKTIQSNLQNLSDFDNNFNNNTQISLNSIMYSSPKSFIFLFLCASLSLIPLLFKKQIMKKFD